MRNYVSKMTRCKFIPAALAAIFLCGSSVSMARSDGAKDYKEHNIKVISIDFEEGQNELAEEGRNKLREVLQQYAVHRGEHDHNGLPGAGVGPGTTGAEDRPPGAVDGEQATQDTMRTVATQHVDSIRIAAWSDSEFDPERSLGSREQELAKNRAESVEKYIKEDLRLDANITKFNMAERPGLMARTFNTEEAELKSIFARRGTPEAERDTDQPELMQIRDHGGPQKAVVIVNLDQRDQD